MMKGLIGSFGGILDRLFSKGILTEEQVLDAMGDIRRALLEADVSLSVVRDFISAIKEKCIGQQVIKSISPKDMIIKIIYDELVKLLGSSEEDSKLNIRKKPSFLMMVGLQGSGKTTSSAKLAFYLRKHENKKPLLVSLDTYRYAAKEQLKQLALANKIDFFDSKNDEPLTIIKELLSSRIINDFDVVILDTAGRLDIDAKMIEELIELKKIVSPQETLLVADSLMGQSAVSIAENFDKQIQLTGVVLTRLDADSRGGAALSIKHVTKKPIKFIGIGEKIENLSLFHPDRIANKILDMGDIVSLVEQAQASIQEDEMSTLTERIKKGKFDLNDYLKYLTYMKKLGGIAKIFSFLPGAQKLDKHMAAATKNGANLPDDGFFLKQAAIICSMTPYERKNPDILNSSRKKRIAQGSGVHVQFINQLLRQHNQIKIQLKTFLTGDFGGIFKTFFDKKK